MFEFKKLCSELEKLDPVERGVLLAEKSASVVNGLRGSDLPFDPVETLILFIMGSVVSDGAFGERDYLFIYPSLVKAFGKDFDLMLAKQTLQTAKDIKKEIAKHANDMMSVIAECDENLASDIVTLCLLTTSVDGKITLKEKRYIRRICRRI